MLSRNLDTMGLNFIKFLKVLQIQKRLAFFSGTAVNAPDQDIPVVSSDSGNRDMGTAVFLLVVFISFVLL